MKDIIQMRISLQDSNPEIWRVIQVAENTTFFELHHIIQITMGWQNYHLFEFNLEGYRIGEVSEDFRFEGYGSDEVIDSKDTKLKEVISGPKDIINYQYDFGDDWEHRLQVQKFLAKDKAVVYPVCLEGEMRCPPEDCGGIYSFYEYLAILKNKKHPEHKEMVTWFPKKYDPAHFDIDAVNMQLQKLDKYIKKWLGR